MIYMIDNNNDTLSIIFIHFHLRTCFLIKMIKANFSIQKYIGDVRN